MALWQVLVTGVTGYIGGSILTHLVNSKDERLAACEITALVRGEDRAKLLESHGIKYHLFEDFNNTEQVKEIASKFDIILGSLVGYSEGPVKALVEGLGKRRLETGKDTYYIHTSGTSNLADQPITGKYHEDRIFSDNEDIYSYEKMRNQKQPYAQRQVELTVIETGLAQGVKTYVIMSPLIYGVGTGFFNRLTIQVPILIRAAAKAKQVQVIGDGKGIWDSVHVEDLAGLYEIFVAKIVASEGLQSGEKGIYFSETANYSWKELAELLGNALKLAGVTETEKVKSITLEEASEQWTGGDTLLAELGFASNSRTKSDKSKALGWRPFKSKKDFEIHFQAEITEVLKQQAAGLNPATLPDTSVKTSAT